MTIQANSGSVLTLDINAKMLDFSGNSGMIINAKGNAENASFKLKVAQVATLKI
jgi:hypothetical protein